VRIYIREAVWKLWDSIGLTWDEAWNEYLDRKFTCNLYKRFEVIEYFTYCRVDPGFYDFHDYCKEKGFPIIIVSR
jgi:2-hydroxy-3-keto-5-methylthiopentenyl-1-phosphate phosphatase